ncbi:MAG TPA: nitrilase-related carbon-nitrogen hydrolase, partial [Thermoanaerobaculia bacterium]|nr:nitrilase-related carbon-nitrogen hydrolase [Thermoanaerobaculia bacterium]
MRLALAQVSAGPDRSANLEKALAQMRRAAAAGAELIAFPELALDRFFPQRPGDASARELAEPVPGPTTERLASLARELGLVTVFNLYERDAEGRILEVNPAVLEKLGYPLDELLGKRFAELTHPSDGRESLERYRELAAGA